MHHIESVTLDELECWHFQHGQAQLLVAKQGAQVLSYQIGDEPPIIWLNEKAQYKQGKGSVQFPHTEPLPTDLVRRVVEFRIGSVRG